MAIVRDGVIEYVGQVLDKGTRIDSLWEVDRYYAVVWTGTEGRSVEYGGRRWMSDDCVTAEVTVDATPAVRASYAHWQAMLSQTTDTKEMVQECYELERGVRVRVIKGRNVPKNTEGTLLKTGHGKFGVWALALKDDGDTFIISASHLLVIPDLEWLFGEE